MIRHKGITLADTRQAWRTLETTHPPTYYLPPDVVAAALVTQSTPTEHDKLIEDWRGTISLKGLLLIAGAFIVELTMATALYARWRWRACA